MTTKTTTEDINWGPILIQRARRSGKTHAMIETVLRKNGVLVCASRNAANAAKDLFPVPVKTTTITEALHHRGYDLGTPFYFDPDAVAQLCFLYESRVDALRAERDAALRRADEAEHRLEEIRELVRRTEAA